MVPKSKSSDIEAFAETFSKKINTEVFSMIKDAAQGKGLEYTQELAICFLARFVGITVYTSLTDKLPSALKTKEDMVKHAVGNFASMKERVQEAVAAGFTGAMKTYTKKEIEYFCAVHVVPPVANKLPC